MLGHFRSLVRQRRLLSAPRTILLRSAWLAGDRGVPLAGRFASGAPAPETLDDHDLKVAAVRKAADGLLVELSAPASMKEMKETHDRVEEWLHKNSGRPGEDESEAKKEVSTRTIMSVVDPAQLPTYIENMALGESVHPNTANALKSTLKNVLLTALHSDCMRNIAIDDGWGGERYLERFALQSRTLPDKQIAIALSYFSDKRTLSKNWKWLVNNHKNSDLTMWLDYKLHVEVEKKASGLAATGDQRLPPPSTHVRIEHQLYLAAKSGSEIEIRRAIDLAIAQGVDEEKWKPHENQLKAVAQEHKRRSDALEDLLQKAADANPNLVAFEAAVAKARSQGISDEELETARSQFKANQVGKQKRDARAKLNDAISAADSVEFDAAQEKAQSLGFSDSELESMRTEFKQRKDMESKMKARDELKEAALSGDPIRFSHAKEAAKKADVGEETLAESDRCFDDVRKAETAKSVSYEALEKAKRDALEELGKAAASGDPLKWDEAYRTALRKDLGLSTQDLEPYQVIYEEEKRRLEATDLRTELTGAAERGSLEDFTRIKERAEKGGLSKDVIDHCQGIFDKKHDSRVVSSFDSWWKMILMGMGSAAILVVMTLQKRWSGPSAADSYRPIPENSWRLLSAPVGNQESQCYFGSSIFRRHTKDDKGDRLELVYAHDLRCGDYVESYGGQLVEVIDVKESMSDEMLTLEAGLAVLEVTPSHRISVPNPSFTGSSQEPPVLPNWKKASELNKGDSVMCEDGEAKELKVGKTQLEEAAPVYNIRFKPDVPVVVFAQPSSILSRGTAHQPMRRGGKAYQRKKENRMMRECESRSIPDTNDGFSE